MEPPLSVFLHTSEKSSMREIILEALEDSDGSTLTIARQVFSRHLRHGKHAGCSHAWIGERNMFCSLFRVVGHKNGIYSLPRTCSPARGTSLEGFSTWVLKVF